LIALHYSKSERAMHSPKNSQIKLSLRYENLHMVINKHAIIITFRLEIIRIMFHPQTENISKFIYSIYYLALEQSRHINKKFPYIIFI
jgi:hypothetical protein